VESEHPPARRRRPTEADPSPGQGVERAVRAPDGADDPVRDPLTRSSVVGRDVGHLTVPPRGPDPHVSLLCRLRRRH
jgi:hypothetical protein